jgi:hypothetical protein
MAFATTSLSTAVAVADKSIVVASATSVAAGRLIRIDGEMMQVAKDYVSGTTVNVLRGLQGTAMVAHPVTSEVLHGLATDFTAPVAQTDVNYPFTQATITKSYSATGAIALPAAGSNGIAVLNAVSTTVLAMTLADPTADMDGCRLTILSRNGTGAHTITVAGGLNGAGAAYNVLTFPAGPIMIELVAYNEAWYVPVAAAMTGTVTLLTGGIA